LKLAAFLHVVDKTKLPGAKHPIQGWLPDLKLVGQPSAQLLLALLAIFSSAANLAITAPGAGSGDNGRYADLLAACDLCGGLAIRLCCLANCFGAKTVTLGSEELGLVCDIAAPVRLHSNAVDRMATAEDAIRLDDILITRSPETGRKCRRFS
jgi:hypothetical protein